MMLGFEPSNSRYWETSDDELASLAKIIADIHKVPSLEGGYIDVKLPYEMIWVLAALLKAGKTELLKGRSWQNADKAIDDAWKTLTLFDMYAEREQRLTQVFKRGRNGRYDWRKKKPKAKSVPMERPRFVGVLMRQYV